MGTSWADHKSKKKKKSFWSVVFSYSMQQQWTISQSDCNVRWKVDFILQHAMTNSVAGWRISKPLSKAKLAPKKIMVTVWWSSVGLIHCSFLNPGETITSEKYALQINEIYWKLQYLQPAFRLIQANQQSGPNSFPQQYLTTHCTTSTSNVERFGLKSFALSTIFIWPLAHRLPLFQASQQLFAEEMLPQ